MFAAVALAHFFASPGANVNFVDELGFTPLHLAADSLQLRAVVALLALGASKSIKSAKGKAPLQHAKEAIKNRTAFYKRLGLAGSNNADDMAALQQIPGLLK